MIGEKMNKKESGTGCALIRESRIFRGSRNGLRPHLERRQSRLTRIFRALRRRGREERTIHIYIIDNGKRDIF